MLSWHNEALAVTQTADGTHLPLNLLGRAPFCRVRWRGSKVRRSHVRHQGRAIFRTLTMRRPSKQPFQ